MSGSSTNSRFDKWWLVMKIFIGLVIVGYLAYIFINVARQKSGEICKSVDIQIVDSAHIGFIDKKEVRRLMQEGNMTLEGKSLESISNEPVATLLKKNPFVKDVTCYKTPDGVFHIFVSQRLPIMRIMADNGDDYYIDDKGRAMQSMGYTADLITATGNVSRDFAKKSLVKLGIFLRDDGFWNDQIVQANVDSLGDISLVPRVGNHIIQLGSVNDLEVKFRNLKSFYKKILPTVGWNKYKIINIEYPSQVRGVKQDNLKDTESEKAKAQEEKKTEQPEQNTPATQPAAKGNAAKKEPKKA